MSAEDPKFHIFGYLYIVVALLGLIVNFMVILTILCTKHIRKQLANYFVMSLTVSGLVFSGFFLPSYAYTLTTGDPMSSVACKILTFGNFFLNGSSTLSIGAMALNRYFAIVLTRKVELVTKRIVCIMIILCYLTPGVLITLGLFGKIAEAGFDPQASRCSLIDKVSKTFKTVLVVLLAVGPIIFIIFCYSHILWEVRKSRKRLTDINQAQKVEASKFRKEVRLTVSVGLMFVGYLVTYIPSMLVNSLKQPEPWHIARQLTSLLVYCGVWVNPLIYGLQNKMFRDAFVTLLRRRICRFRIVAVPVATTQNTDSFKITSTHAVNN